MNLLASASTTPRAAGSFGLLFVFAALVAACGDDAPANGSGGATTSSTGAGETGGNGTGGEGSGGEPSCACPDGQIAIAACDPQIFTPPCETVTCGTETIGCIPTKPCDDTPECLDAAFLDYGCETAGEECFVPGCEGEGGQNVLCTEDHIWTDWSDVYFSCGDEKICTLHEQYCLDVSEQGNDQTYDCVDIPDGCTDEGFCDCEEAFAVCDAECSAFAGGGWVVSCWNGLN